MSHLVRSFFCALALVPVAALSQTVPLTQDSYFASFNGGNFGNTSTINVGGPNVNQALVQFDLTALPSGVTSASVSKAILTLFVNRLGAAGSITISVANGAWTELGVNGTNNPVPAAAVASRVPVSVAGGYLTVDATAAVKNWLSGTTNNGFIVLPADANVNLSFDSKESITTSHPATLAITLNSSGAAGATGPAGAMGATCHFQN